eukprot:6186812-Pleurochrysis_carterae.AAC.2
MRMCVGGRAPRRRKGRWIERLRLLPLRIFGKAHRRRRRSCKLPSLSRAFLTTNVPPNHLPCLAPVRPHSFAPAACPLVR